MKSLTWKATAILLLLILACTAVGMGYYWSVAAHDRDQALAEFAAERQASDELRTAIREQNRATEALASQKAAAEERGAQAQQLAAANGRRFDGALDQIKSARATTCDEAMPAVNRILEAIR